MLKQFQTLIVWLSLSLFIAAANDWRCSIVPAKSVAIVDETHEFTCLALPGTMIISWKLGLEPKNSSFNFGTGTNISQVHQFAANISSLGVVGTDEPEARGPADGYKIVTYSLRKSTMKITGVKDNHARPFYCTSVDTVERKRLYCESKLNVLVNRPSFGSTGLDLAEGIVTNVTCSVKFKGSAMLYMTITDQRNVIRQETVQNFTGFGTHSYNLNVFKKVKIVTERGYSRVSPASDLSFQSAYRCTIALDHRDVFLHVLDCEVDAPVTYASIVPYNRSRCSSRRCYLHEKLTCTSDGRPEPNEFHWRLAVKHDVFRPMPDKTPDQYVLIRGRNTFECRVYQLFSDHRFTAAGRLTIHVEAFEWKLDEYATYESKGNKHKVSYPVTMYATVTGLILVFLFSLLSSRSY